MLQVLSSETIERGGLKLCSFGFKENMLNPTNDINRTIIIGHAMT